MKKIARSYFWWPNLDKEIERKAQSCIQCKSSQANPRLVPLHPWVWPTHPWSRVHTDYAGLFLQRMYLIVVDSHSKWPDVIEMAGTSSESTISEL